MKKIFKKIVQYYLWFLTKLVLWRHKPEIIAVSGSTNKSTTKEAIKEVLSKKFNVRANPRSYNTEIGLPLAVLYLESGLSSFSKWFSVLIKGTKIVFFNRDFPQKLVLEYGIDCPADMNYLLTLAKPKISVLTDVTPQYIDNFDDFDKIIEEYAKLIKALPSDGLAVLNFDDRHLVQIAKESKAPVVFIGETEGAHLNFVVKKQEANLCQFDVKIGTTIQSYEIQRTGTHHIFSFLAALAIEEFYSNR